MKRKKGVLLIIVFILIIAGILLYLFYRPGLSLPFLGNGSESPNPDLFPHGEDQNGTGSTTHNNTENSEMPQEENNGQLPVLREISHVAVSGAMSVYNPEKETTSIRYLERPTGHIFETTTLTSSLARVTNTTIPKVQNVVWDHTGNALILQYEAEEGGRSGIVSFYGEVVGATSTTAQTGVQTETTLGGIYLPGNKIIVTPSPDNTHIFSLEQDSDGSGGVTGVISALNGSERKEVFSSPISEWQAQWPEEKTVVLTSNSSGRSLGFSYALDVSTGKRTPLLTGKVALNVLPNHDVSKILYSHYRANEGLFLSIYDKTEATSIDVPLRTFPEKCAWGKAGTNIIYCGVPTSPITGTQPDEWYQGNTVFSDAIWSIDATTGAVNMILALEIAAGKGLDVFEPFVDENDTYLFFTDLNNLHLWSLKIGI